MTSNKWSIILVALAFLLVGCANTATIKLNANQLNGAKVYLVPTGQTKVKGLSGDTIGSYFGVVGVLIEHAATSGQRNADAAQADVIFSSDATLQIASDEIEQFLREKKSPQEITLHPIPLEGKAFEEWFNPDQRNDIPADLKINGALIVDYGFQDITLRSFLTATYAVGTIGIRVIDPVSGKVIARARTFEVGGEKIKDNSDANAYKNEVKAAFSRVIRRLVQEAFNKML